MSNLGSRPHFQSHNPDTELAPIPGFGGLKNKPKITFWLQKSPQIIVMHNKNSSA